MTEKAPSFRSVMRGYDPAQVDTHLGELTTALEAARREAADRTVELSKTQTAHADLSAELDDLRGHATTLEQAQRTAGQPSYQDLGERIGKILHLAEQEAADMRATAAAEADDHRASAVAAAETLKAGTTRQAEEIRSRAEAEAAGVLENAHRQADEVLDEAERAAQTRREEAEALYESQRAKVSAAAADFETTLAERRDKAAAEFSGQLALHEQRLTEVRSRAATLAEESEQAHAQARSRTDALLEAARVEASQLVKSAREQAERIRTESERELAAATTRRDSINSQLANVRQMLSTLGGAALAQQVVPDAAPAAPEPAAEQPAAEQQPADQVTEAAAQTPQAATGRDAPSEAPTERIESVEQTNHSGQPAATH